MRSDTLADVRTPHSSGNALAALPRAWRQGTRDPFTWLLVAGCLAAIALSTMGIARSLDGDEGAFLAIAQLVLDGRVPYRDVFDQKGPGIYYYLAAILAITAQLSPLQQIIAARIGVELVNLLTAFGLVLLGKRWWRLEVGLLAGLLWLICLPVYGGDQFFTEPFAAAATVWAVVVALRWPGVRGALGAGLLIALGSIFKQTTILALPGVALAVLAARPPAGRPWWRPSRLALARLSALVAGVCAPWTIVCLLFAFTGGLGALLDQVVVANLVRYPADPPTAIRASIAGDISALWGFWLILGALLLVGVMRWAGIPRSWRHTPGLAVWVTVLIGALNLVPFASHAYPHYFLQLLPWAALLVALAFLPALDAWRAAVRRTAPTVEAIPARALLASVALAGLLLLLSPPAQLPPTQWQADATEAQSQANVGTWIASYTPPNARLLIAPTDPSYYFLARRTPAVPYVYLLPINLSPSLLTSATEQVRTRQFDVVVWQLGGVIGGQAPQFATLYQALITHYHLVARNTRLNISIYMPNVLG